ncbi:hypothetical protein GIW45_25910 [Pseudomonas congelans]|uniref:hypothetical protein n=1 Tax=Pseudomonas congelans TaxID=200452 RepID=UPI001F96533D|nr:hypothetical protein [Pseudomonas congelans]
MSNMPMFASVKPRPLKSPFAAKGCWATMLEVGGLREIKVGVVSEMLACGPSILSVKRSTKRFPS